MSDDAKPADQPADGLPAARFVVETTIAMKPKRYKSVAKLSIGRLFKLMLCWMGMPAALAFGSVFGHAPAPTALDLWFYTGAGILLLNLSGLVPIRRYSRLEIRDDAE